MDLTITGGATFSKYTYISFNCPPDEQISPDEQIDIENLLRQMGGTPDLTRQDPRNREYCWKIDFPTVVSALSRSSYRHRICTHQIMLAEAPPPTITLPEYDTAWNALAAASQISAQLNGDMAKKRGQKPDPVETLGSVTECADAAQQALSKVSGNDANPNNRRGLVRNGFGFYSGITSILLGQKETKGIISTPAILGLGDILEQTKPGNGKEESSEVQGARETAEAAYDTVLAFYHQKYPPQTQ